MRIILLAASATVAAFAFATPAAAQSSTAGAFVGVPAVNVHRGSGDFRGDFNRRRHHRGFDNGVVYLDREYQGDTLWRPDSFNDWWHDRCRITKIASGFGGPVEGGAASLKLAPP